MKFTIFRYLLMLSIAVACSAQSVTVAPTGFQIPYYNAPDWHNPLDYNFTLLNGYLSGTAVPGRGVIPSITSPVSGHLVKIVDATGVLTSLGTLAQCSAGQFQTGMNTDGSPNCGVPAAGGNTLSSGLVNGNLTVATGANAIGNSLSAASVVINNTQSLQTLSGQVNAPNVNNNASVDGTSTGTAGWIGAWSSVTAYQTCNAVSFSGTNYVATSNSTNQTPGSSLTYWAPTLVSGSPVPTQSECAFYSSLGRSNANSILPLNTFGSAGTYNLCAGLNMGASQTVGVQLAGSGAQTGSGTSNIPMTQLVATCSGLPTMLYHGDESGSQFGIGGLTLRDLAFNANNIGRAFDINNTSFAKIYHVSAINTNDSDHAAQLGDPSPPGGMVGKNSNLIAEDIFIAGTGNTTANWASVAASGATLGTVTISTAGSYKNATPPVEVFGTAAGSNKPCTVIGTPALTMAGSGPYTVSALSFSGYSGCSAPIYVVIPDYQTSTYGLVSNSADSSLKDVDIWNIGRTAALVNYGGDVYWTHAHPLGGINSIQDFGGATWDFPFTDTPIHYGMDLESQSTIQNGAIYWANASPGSGNYYLGTNSFYSKVIGSTCGNNQTAGGYSLFTTPSGPVNFAANPPVFPAGFVAENVDFCDGSFRRFNWDTGGYVLGQQYMVLLSAATGLTITPNTTGATSITYFVQPYTADGTPGPGATAVIANSAATPNNTISWTAVNNAAFYKYGISAGGGTIGVLGTTASQTATDTTGVGDGSTYSANNHTSKIVLGNGAFTIGSNGAAVTIGNYGTEGSAYLNVSSSLVSTTLPVTTGTINGATLSGGSAAPSGACSNGAIYAQSGSNGQLWFCTSTAWVQVTVP